MRVRSSRIGWLVGLVIATSGAGFARADGKFFRNQQVADEPGIRAQRAVLAFRNGVETLIVQSDVAGAGAEFAWVLPLPAEPTAIEPCPPNTLTALNALLQPEIATYPKELLLLAALTALLSIGYSYLHLRAKSRGRTPISPVTFVSCVLAISLFVMIMMTTTLGYTKGVAEVDVLQSQRVGVYNVNVIKGSTGSAVEHWLTSNGFASSAAAQDVIAAYASEGWCFLTAKVVSDAKGEATHHPLSITFPTAPAVYPMRLTGVDSGPVQLNLFVIGDQVASLPPLRTWYTDSFVRVGDYPHEESEFGAFAATAPHVFRASKLFARVGLPAVSTLMWPGCVVTRLHGRLRPAEMHADLRPDWRTEEARRAKVYSRKAALAQAGVFAAGTFVILMLMLTRDAGRQGWTVQTLLRRRGLLIVLLSAVVGVAHYAALDVVPAMAKSGTILNAYGAERQHVSALNNSAEQTAPTAFPEAYAERLRADTRRGSRQDAMDLEFTNPGDYRIDAASNGWRLTIIDRWYVPVSIAIPSNGIPIRAEGDDE